MASLNILKGELDIVFVALNPTEEALKNGAVFSTDRGLWNILEKSGLINSSANNYPLKDMAKVVFNNQQREHVNYRMGFADLVDNCYSKSSNDVIVPKGAAKKLASILINKHKVKVIALLGQKVVDSFASEFPKKKGIGDGLFSWKQASEYGSCIGTIEGVSIIKLPFPVNNSVPNKHIYYSKLISYVE